MKNFKCVINPLKWTSVQLLAAFMAGCGNDSGAASGHDSAITGNTGTSPVTAEEVDTFTCQKMPTSIIYGTDTDSTGNGDPPCFKGTAADNTVVVYATFCPRTAYIAVASMHISFPNNKLEHQVPVMAIYGINNALLQPGKVIKQLGGNGP